MLRGAEEAAGGHVHPSLRPRKLLWVNAVDVCGKLGNLTQNNG